MTTRAAAVLALSLASVGLAGQSPAPAALPEYARPALAALAKPQPPAAFAFDVNPFALPTSTRPGLVALYVRIPGDALLAAGNMKTGTFTAGAAILARFVDAAGTVAHQETQELPLHGLQADARTMLSRPMETSWQFDLPPGKYTLEVAAYDEGGRNSSVIKRPFEVPGAERPTVGDLIVVDSARKLPAGDPEDPSDPLITNHLRLHPAFDPSANRGLQTDVNFALAMVVDPAAPLPKSTLALLDDKGAPLAAVDLPLGAPDSKGGLIALGRIPLSRVPPGKYRLQVTIGVSPHARVRTNTLTVVD
jgi:hypothetical protein